MTDQSVLSQSVTANDYQTGNAYYFRAGSPWVHTGSLIPSLEGLSLSESDFVTISTLDHEALWAGAVAIAVTKVSSLAWEIDSNIQLRTKRAHELLLNADAGKGWVSFISKILQDYLLTNNGCFIEIVRANKSLNAQIIGIIPLDSMRCIRTGNPDRPVCYRDLLGSVHELRAGDVLEFSDMPSSRASLYGSGKCAASRAYTSIYKLACIEQYISDKVSGRRPLAINLINGLNDVQLKAVLATAQSEANAKGIISYMGAIVATVPGESVPGIATIPLADFPDNFNRKEELDIAVLSYADNLGLDVQDIQPLTGRALGTGAQSQVLDEKAKGKGLASFRQQLVQGLNTWVLPEATTIEFIERDWRDKNLNATYNSTTEGYINRSVERGIITAGQGLQALVDENVYPQEFLPVDETPDTTLEDTEKPNMETPEDMPGVDIPEVNVPAQPEISVPIVKETTAELIDQEYEEAQKLVKKIMRTTH